MKKTALILCLALAFVAVSCKGSCNNASEREKVDYARQWNAADDSVGHGTGEAAEGGWGSASGVRTGGVLASATDELASSLYEFTASVCTDGYSAENNNAVVKLRAIGESGAELGSSTVYMSDFTASLVYGEFSFTFDVPAKQSVGLEIYWPGYEYARVEKFALKSVESDTTDYSADPFAMLGIDKNESVPAIKDNALYVFDACAWAGSMKTDADYYDIFNLVSTLQGLVNREGIHLYINGTVSYPGLEDVDAYWLDALTEDGEWLADRDIVEIQTPITLLKMFSSYFKGWAVWDQQVPSTVNAVATACGADDLLPLRWSSDRSSLYAYLTDSKEFASKPVAVDLANKFLTSDPDKSIYGTDIPCTGSRKNDVYLWAKANYLDKHKTASHMMAYHVDAYSKDTVCVDYQNLATMYLQNRDYYIAEKAFFFDLSAMKDEVPIDDPDQAKLDLADGTVDFRTFTAIMKAQNAYAQEVDPDRPIDVGGFVPWEIKYSATSTPGASGDWDVEWETVYQFSLYYAQINADAPGYTAMSNASIYRQFPMKQRYKHTGKYSAGNVDTSVTLPSSSERGVSYLLFYYGDFDSSAWLNTNMPTFWNDEKRGAIPICYSFALDLYKRAGHVIDWMYETAGENDYFVSGDNGTGYLNPEAFFDARRQQEGLGGNLATWTSHNEMQFDRFGIDINGFLILTGRAKNAYNNILTAYSTFSPVGLGTNDTSLHNANVRGMQVVHEVDYSAVSSLTSNVADKKNDGKCSFTMVRFVLQSPTNIYNIYQTLINDYPSKNFKLLDPYTFFALQEQYVSTH